MTFGGLFSVSLSEVWLYGHRPITRIGGAARGKKNTQGGDVQMDVASDVHGSTTGHAGDDRRWETHHGFSSSGTAFVIKCRLIPNNASICRRIRPRPARAASCRRNRHSQLWLPPSSWLLTWRANLSGRLHADQSVGVFPEREWADGLHAVSTYRPLHSRPRVLEVQHKSVAS
jgi:hypothetical protein